MAIAADEADDELEGVKVSKAKRPPVAGMSRKLGDEKRLDGAWLDRHPTPINALRLGSFKEMVSSCGSSAGVRFDTAAS